MNLTDYARNFQQVSRSVSARDNFLLRLALVKEPEPILSLMREFHLEPEIVANAAAHLLKIDTGPEQLTAAAQLVFAHGFDELSLELAKQALVVKEEFCPALVMLAQLSPDVAERKRIYTRILELEPGNMQAFENLVMLRTAADELKEPKAQS